MNYNKKNENKCKKADLKEVCFFTFILLFYDSVFYIQTVRYNCNREREKNKKDREEKENLKL